MSTVDLDDPDEMSAAERVDAIATLLAEAVIRCRARHRSIANRAIEEPETNRLEVSREMHLDGADGFTPAPPERSGI